MREQGKAASDLELGLCLLLLRMICGLSQQELARKAGTRAPSISSYERGGVIPDLSTLGKLLRGMGLPMEALDEARKFIRSIKHLSLSSSAGHPTLASTNRELERLAAHVVTVLTQAGRDFISLAIEGIVTAQQGGEPAEKRDDERASGALLWEKIKSLPYGKQRSLLLTGRQFHDKGLFRSLCEESVDAAAYSPKRAHQLALLAILLAQTLEDGSGVRSLEGYATAFLANAYRVQGELLVAEEKLAESEVLRPLGTTDDLDESYRFTLKASLRRTQGRFDEALELHSLALQARGADRIRAKLLISQAYTLSEKGDFEASSETLERAAGHLTSDDDPRLLMSLHHNLADTLSKMDRFQEAQKLLPDLNLRVQALGTDLDKIRFKWIAGRVAGGLGNIEEAVELLLHVRAALSERRILYDSTLASLELALLYAKAGRTEGVRDLARHLAPLFRIQSLPKETLAALSLFRQAAEGQQSSVTLLEQLVHFLRRYLFTALRPCLELGPL